LGYSKRYMFGKRLEIGLGGDIVLNSGSISTVNIQSVGFGGSVDSTVTTSRSTTLGFGLGPQLNISYYLTDNIRIGTEATYYFISTAEKLNVRVEQFSSGFGGSNNTVTNENDSTSSSDLSLTIPVVLYLTLVFYLS